MLLVRKKYLSFGVGVFLEEVTDNFIKTIDGQRYVNCGSVCVVIVFLH